MSKGKPVRWGILSTSRTALNKAIPALQRCAHATVDAIASRDPDKARNAASDLGIPKAYGDYAALIRDPDIDAVYLSLPNSLHADYTRRIAKAGKHVLCEKPAATTPAAAAGMIDACNLASVLFMEGFAYRFLPQTKFLKELVSSRRIGDVRVVRIAFSFTLQDRHSRIRLKRALDGGALADLGIYAIDLVRHLVGLEPSKVYCVGNHGGDGEVETDFAAVLEFPGGVHALLNGAFDQPRQSWCEVVGSLGRVSTDSVFPSDTTQVVHTDSAGKRTATSFDKIDQFELQFEHFSRCIVSGSKPAISAEETVGNAAVLDALRRSLTLHAPISIEKTAPILNTSPED